MTKNSKRVIDGTLQPKGSKSARLVAASALTKISLQTRPNTANVKTIARDAKSGRFSEGVRHVSTRDRAGLIKLADR